MQPWRTSSVFLMGKMIILGPSHLNHWHKPWATPSLLWSPTCSHPVILLYRRLRMQVRFFLFFFNLTFSARIFILVLIFCLTAVIQELQLKLREHCYQVTTPQNFRPAPGTVCCAQFSGTVKLSEHQSKFSSITTRLHLKVVLGC